MPDTQPPRTVRGLGRAALFASIARNKDPRASPNLGKSSDLHAVSFGRWAELRRALHVIVTQNEEMFRCELGPDHAARGYDQVSNGTYRGIADESRRRAGSPVFASIQHPQFGRCRVHGDQARSAGLPVSSGFS